MSGDSDSAILLYSARASRTSFLSHNSSSRCFISSSNYSLKILRIHRSDSSSVAFQRKKRSVLAAAISPATDRASDLYHGKVVDEGHAAAGLEGEMGSIVLVELEPAVEDVALTVVWK